MDANPFDLAEEFCRLVGVHSLLDYLGVTADTAPAEVQERLRSRRKHMQGMQSNPKYKGEALFLIRNFSALSESLTDPQVYSEDVARRNESSHLQILEMTIRGMLAGQTGGLLTAQQEAYLRKNAKELRISERSYERLLRRLGVETGVELPLPPPTPSMVPQLTPVGLPPVGGQSPLHGLGARTPLPPPFQPRKSSDTETAPPVRARSVTPQGNVMPARLEIPGDPTRKIVLGETNAVVVAIRNGGDLPMPGTVETDVPWLIPVQSELDAEAPSQTIEVRIAPGLVDEMTRGTITIATKNAGAARIEVELVRKGRSTLLALAVGVPVFALLAFLAVGLWWWGGGGSTELTVHVDPVGVVTLNGQPAGVGTTVVVEAAPTGPVEVEVKGNANFKPFNQTIDLHAGEHAEIDAHLDLAEPIGSFSAGEAPPCEDVAARRAVGERLPGLKHCIAATRDAEKLHVTVRIDQKGLPAGMDLAGPALTGAERECVERQVGAMALTAQTGDACLVSFEIPRP
jgi:hypothetical protein